MTQYRTTARLVGGLFITATVAALVGGSLLLPIIDAGNADATAVNEAQIVTGALIEIVLVLSVVGIAVLLFPVLRQRSEGAALAYVGSRMLEAVLLLTATVSALVLLTLTLDGTQPGSPIMLAVRDWTYLIGSEFMLGVSALILYSLLYRADLVPAWLSLWGLAGGLLIGLSGVLGMYDVTVPDWVAAVLVAPIALNEMVLALWLIVRGFSQSALAAARG